MSCNSTLNILLISVFCFAFGNIHEHMTEPELLHYFQVSQRDLVPKYEVVYFPAFIPIREAYNGNKEMDISFTSLGRPVSLKLKQNPYLVSPLFKSYVHNGHQTKILSKPDVDCHYLHDDDTYVAAVSVCEPKSLLGFVFFENSTLEIKPLSERLRNLYAIQEPLNNWTDLNEKVPHIIRQTSPLKPDVCNYIEDPLLAVKEKVDGVTEEAKLEPLTLELSLFFDESAYKIFGLYMDYNYEKIQHMLLAYLNGVQALYHHPSIGTPLELVLVRMDIMKKQPPKMPHYGGERSKLLDSFCQYQSELNSPNDNDPNHWDMALYISGLDFYAYENGHRSDSTMGLATVGGVCLAQYACIIAELGTTNIFGKPYPSAGFTSVYILAHEIGHNLGMRHDSSGNNCPKEGYIMSPSRGTQGETQWSTCSAEVMSNLGWATCLKDRNKSPPALDHTRYLNSPGLSYSVKKQCEILLKDKDAVMSPSQELSSVCYSLQCKSPHKSGFYFAGPALEGTQCGTGKYCYGGTCIKKSMKPVKVIPGGWSSWKDGRCTSGCIENSRGYQTKTRMCNNPIPQNTNKGCKGNSYETALCDDEMICGLNKKNVTVYASEKCKEFSTYLSDLDRNGEGLQSPHEADRLWVGCAIFCKKPSGIYYTPRVELNDFEVSPYFPDGTKCHEENGLKYYCIQHHCLPENFKFSKNTVYDLGKDFNYPQNAYPNQIIPSDIKNYLSLNGDGHPIKTWLIPNDNFPKQDEWEADDYLLLPRI